MDIIKYIFFYAIIILFTGCENKVKFMEVIYPNGATKKILLIDKIGANGIEKSFYLNKRVFSIKKTSKWKGYKNEEIQYYYKNGEIMDYRYYHDNKLVYYRKYNSDGISESYKGRGLLFQDTIAFDTIYKDASYESTLEFVNPPKCKVRVLIGNEVANEKERNIQKNPLYFYPIQNSKTKYRISYDKVGEISKVIYWSIEDTISHDIQKGKAVQKYIVKALSQEERNSQQ